MDLRGARKQDSKAVSRIGREKTWSPNYLSLGVHLYDKIVNLLGWFSRQREPHLKTAREEQIPEYGQLEQNPDCSVRVFLSSSDVLVLLLNQPT